MRRGRLNPYDEKEPRIRCLLHRGCVLLVLLTLGACATTVPRWRFDAQELVVPQAPETAYGRAQQAALRLGMQITERYDLTHVFAASRPTGERVEVSVQRFVLGALVTISSSPAHDVSDLITAYQRER